jgi:hypothetical protein
MRPGNENNRDIGVARPLTSHETYHMAAGKTCDTVDTMVLRIDTAQRAVGLGRGLPDPALPAAYAGGVIPAIAEMAGQLGRTRFR